MQRRDRRLISEDRAEDDDEEEEEEEDRERIGNSIMTNDYTKCAFFESEFD